MNIANHTLRLSTAALLSAALCALPATAQVQVQQGGALDANQQVGSGGYNRAAEQPDYRARNLLVTGNVGGGRAFRGSINYTAEGTFQGTLGSDSLFNFQRDSIYSAPGAPTNLGAYDYGDRVIVTRATTSTPGYRVNTGGNLYDRTNYDPSAGVVTFRQSGGGLVAVTGIKDPTQLNRGGSSLGLINTPQGLLSIDASPLTGIRYNPLDVNPGGQRPGIDPTNNNLRTNPLDAETLDPRDANPETDPSLSRNLRIDGQYRPAPTDDERAALNLREDPLSITLGTQVQAQMALQLAGRDDNNLPNAQAQSIRQQVFGMTDQASPDQPPKPATNPYDKLIADILAQSKDEEAPEVKPQPEDEDRPRWQQILEEPEQAIRDAKLKARDTALRISLGMVDEDGNVDYEKKLPSIDPESDLGKLLKDLSYDLPRVKTLAGKDENRINTLMVRGEQELKAERYIVAENVYRQVMRETGDDPLAKAGLIHSQMGAGMIRSAAFNLRGLFADHPELIALRYEENLLPDTERLRWLQGRLQKMINEDLQGADPGLVLAYLGYQLEAKPLIEFGLAVAESEAPRDPLMPVLRKIWLEGNKDAGDKPEAQDKPAEAEPEGKPAEPEAEPAAEPEDQAPAIDPALEDAIK